MDAGQLDGARHTDHPINPGTSAGHQRELSHGHGHPVDFMVGGKPKAWQRGKNLSTNGLLRHYRPTSELGVYTAEH